MIDAAKLADVYVCPEPGCDFISARESAAHQMQVGQAAHNATCPGRPVRMSVQPTLMSRLAEREMPRTVVTSGAD